MLRLALKILLPLLGIAAAILAAFVYHSSNARYIIHELIQPSRFHQLDPIIIGAANRNGIDPMLLKAIIWRESRFRPEKVGRHGERGLMQLSVAAGGDWAKASKIEPFDPESLLDAKTNVEAGAWYLKQALQRWSDRDDPVPFALAEYNAGRKNVERWVLKKQLGEVTAKELLENFSFPNTRSYIQGILARYDFYKKRGRL
jgi:soluble lytic murein transglycosylase